MATMHANMRCYMISCRKSVLDSADLLLILQVTIDDRLTFQMWPKCYQVFKLIYNDNIYTLHNVFRSAELSGRIFDEWFGMMKTHSVVSGIDDPTFRLLLAYLNCEECPPNKERVDAEQVVNLCADWAVEGLFDWYGLTSTKWLVAGIGALHAAGYDTDLLETKLQQRLLDGDLDGLNACPLEIAVRIAHGAPTPIKVKMARIFTQFSFLFLDDIRAEDLQESDLQDLEGVAGGQDLISIYQQFHFAAEMEARFADQIAAITAERDRLLRQLEEGHVQQLEDEQSRFELKEKELLGRISTLETDNSILQGEVDLSQAEITQHQVKINELSSKADQYDELERELFAVREELATEQMMVQAKSDKIADLKRELHFKSK